MKWTDDEIRKAAGWQAYRDGKTLAEQAAPVGLKGGEQLATATFRQGKRRIRTVVTWRPHLEVECGCVENRRDGSICAHAVAVLLCLTRGTDTESGGAADTGDVDGEMDDAPGEVPAYEIEFAPDLSRQLGAGKCHARVVPAGTCDTSADRRFYAWLKQRQLHDPKMLSIRSGDLPEFFSALGGHERLRDAEGQAVSLRRDPISPVPLTWSECAGECVKLRVEPVSAAFLCGDRLYGRVGNVIGPFPVETTSSDWREQVLTLLQSGQLELARDAFLAEINAWLDLFASPAAGWLGELVFRRVAPTIEFELEGSLRALDGKLSVPHGETVHFHEPNRIEIPDANAREKARERLRRAGFEFEGSDCRLRDADAILSFLADDLPALEKIWQVRVGERLQHGRQSVHVVRPVFAEVTGQNQSLALELSFQTDAGKAIPGSKIRDILRSGRQSTTTRSGAQVVISREIHEQLEPLLADLGIPSGSDRILQDQATREALLNFREKSDNTFSSNQLKSLTKIDNQLLAGVTLRAYQREGVSWLCDRLTRYRGAVLADEMGLGKTIQTIVSITQLKQTNKLNSPCLVVVPTSLIGNWLAEFERFAPELDVVVLHGPDRDRRRDRVADSDVVVTSYGTLVRDLAFHLRTGYGLLVADEASVLRNPDSEVSRVVAKLEPGMRLALTGTPIENRPLDLWSIFRVVAPGYLGSKAGFRERYEGGGSSVIQRLKWRVSPYLLRRAKSDVATDLPERMELDHWLELDDEARAVYRELASAGLQQWEALQGEGQTGAASMHLLTVLLRLRQVCLSRDLCGDETANSVDGVKTDWLESCLGVRFEAGQKTLVFSQFADYLHRLKDRLGDRFGACFLLDGSTRDRAGMVEAFQSHAGPAVFLISLKAGGYGLNLTAADAVVHMDPWWNPAAEAQASDRAHRIGQDRPVTVHRLLIRDSVEERVKRLQAAKKADMEDFQGDGAPMNWDRGDLRGLIEL